MPENRLDHLIHLGGVPQNRVAHPEQARPGNKNNASIVEVGKATRWKPGQSGNPGGRPKKTPYADACRALANLTEEQVMERNPQDSFPLAVAKAVGRAALEGGVHALAELANRAEGRPAQAVVQQSDAPSDALTATIRIALARCAAYNLPVPDFLRDAEKLILGPDEAMTTSCEPEPPGDNESAHKATTQDVEGGHE